MEKNLEITFRDVYGGDGFTRIERFTEKKLSRTKSKKQTRKDINITIETETEEKNSEMSERDIQTFRFENDIPYLRLGGSHGKLWGALRDIRKSLYMLGNKSFRSSSLIDMIQITPVWVPFEKLEPIKEETLPQILNAPGRPMIIMKFDVIPRAKCSVKITYPEVIESQVDIMLEQLKSISLLNKRRATIESIVEK